MNSGTCRRRGWVGDEIAGSGGIVVAAACAGSGRGDMVPRRRRDEGVGGEHRRRRLYPVVVVFGAVRPAASRGGFFAPGCGRRRRRGLLLPDLLAQPRVPEVLDLVVRSPRQPRRDLGPAIQIMTIKLVHNRRRRPGRSGYCEMAMRN